MKHPTARNIALTALTHIYASQADAQEALSGQPEFAGLTARDRAFARLLVMTTLRRHGQLNALLAQYVTRALPKRYAYVQVAMQLGAVQLLWLGTPPHAAVHQTVELVEKSHKGLVNAVLKRVVQEGPSIIVAQDEARLNTPDWLWESWVKDWGEEKTRAIATAHLREPPLDITVKENPTQWAKALNGMELPTGSVRCMEGSRIAELPGYDDGAWWVQDAAAALPARLLGHVRGKTVLDLCAAPGGKTAQLAAAGAHVTAVDISEHRLKRLHENMARLKLDVKTVTADILAWRPETPPDAVLLDAPCSATGTLRRHPEGLLRKTPEDAARMVSLQQRMLAQALDWLPSGGVLVYCTCSLQKEEGEQQIEWLLQSRKDISLIPIRAEEVGGQSQFITSEGTLRTLPHYWQKPGGMDGFFAARLKKI